MLEKRSIYNTPEELPEREGIRVWWLVNKDAFASSQGMFALTEFAPGAQHELHRHLNCETVTFILQGSILYLNNGEPIRLKEREVVYIPPGDWHGFYNDDNQPATLITLYGGAASLEQAGYEAFKSEQQKLASNAIKKLPAPSGDILHDPTLTYDPTLTEELGFYGMGNHWYVRAETVGSKQILAGITRFEAGGRHVLHIHESAEEFFFILQGSGTHLTENGEVPLHPGELAFTSKNKPHGFRNNPSEVTLVLFGWFGAANVESSGYQIT